jgi:hypothetical protein
MYKQTFMLVDINIDLFLAAFLKLKNLLHRYPPNTDTRLESFYLSLIDKLNQSWSAEPQHFASFVKSKE